MADPKGIPGVLMSLDERDAYLRSLGIEPKPLNVPDYSRRERQPRPAKAGLVYAVRIQEFVKIGVTAGNLRARLTQIQTGSPFQIEVLAVIHADDIVALENDLHEQFEHRHHRGEWFSLTDEDIQYLQALASGEP